MARTTSWARSVTDDHPTLVVRLDPPDRSDAWQLEVFAPGPDGSLLPIEHAIVNGGSGRSALEGQLARLERMLPALRRPSSVRGRVILDGEEAWEMASRGVDLLRTLSIASKPRSVVSALPIAEAILEARGKLGAGMLVMGAYTRSRLSEMIWGSVTRTLLEKCPVPIFLHH